MFANTLYAGWVLGLQKSANFAWVNFVLITDADVFGQHAFLLEEEATRRTIDSPNIFRIVLGIFY